LSVQIVAPFEAHRHVYGTRRLKDCLADEGRAGKPTPDWSLDG